MVDGGAAEGCVEPVLLPDVRDKLVDYTILDPPKRLIGIDKSVLEADAKGKMPIILTHTNVRKLSAPLSMLEVLGIGYHTHPVVDVFTRAVVRHFD